MQSNFSSTCGPKVEHKRKRVSSSGQLREHSPCSHERSSKLICSSDVEKQNCVNINMRILIMRKTLDVDEN